MNVTEIDGTGVSGQKTRQESKGYHARRVLFVMVCVLAVIGFACCVRGSFCILSRMSEERRLEAAESRQIQQEAAVMPVTFDVTDMDNVVAVKAREGRQYEVLYPDGTECSILTDQEGQVCIVAHQGNGDKAWTDRSCYQDFRYEGLDPAGSYQIESEMYYYDKDQGMVVVFYRQSVPFIPKARDGIHRVRIGCAPDKHYDGIRFYVNLHLRDADGNSISGPDSVGEVGI